LSLASTLQAQGSFADAEQTARDAHAIFVELLGGEHRLVAASLLLRGANLYELKRLDEAEADLVRALDLTRKTLGEDHVQFASVLYDYGKVLLARGRLRDAEATFRTTVDRRRAIFGDGNMFTADAQAWLARCLVADSRFAEAEPLLLESYPILVEALGAEYPDTVAARRTLHELYTAWGKPVQAATYR
jgi:tetratricopeptide (TPR) repeat protein